MTAPRRTHSEINSHHLWLKDGTWFIRYRLPDQPPGKRLCVSTGTGDQRRAAAIRDQVLAPLLQESDIGNITRRFIAQLQSSDERAKSMVAALDPHSEQGLATGPTLGEAIQRFLDNRKVFKQNSGRTIEDYACTLAMMQKIIGNVRLQHITAKDLRGIRDRLMAPGSFRKYAARKTTGSRNPSRGVSPKTVTKYMRNIATFFGWAVKEELVEKNPMGFVDLPKAQRNPTPCPPIELADALCAVAYPGASELGRLEWEVLPWVFRYTGARCGEVCRLAIEDIVIESGIRCFRMFTEKTGTRKGRTEADPRRLVPIHPKLAPIVDRVLAARRDAAPSDLLFPNTGTRVSGFTGYRRFGDGWSHKYAKHAKRIWSAMHVHCWRTYAISEMARQGVLSEIRKRVVGHTISDVHDGYTHIDVKTLAEAVAKIR